VINRSSINPKKIIGVGITGHGDGLYPIDKDGNPVRNAILAFDNREAQIIEE